MCLVLCKQPCHNLVHIDSVYCYIITTIIIGSLLLYWLLQLYQTCPDRVSTLYPASLNLYGSWLAETRSENPTEIISSYLELSVNLMEELHISDLSAVMEAYLTLARYADNQYRRIERQMESSAFEAKRHLLQKSKVYSLLHAWMFYTCVFPIVL